MTPRIFPITSRAGTEGGPRSKTLVQVIRRTIAVMAVPALLSPALIVASPATASTRTACSKVYFFGAHGVNEGSSGAKPGKAHWGTPVDAVWNALVSKLKPNAPTGISANYTRSVIDLPKWLGGPGLPKGPSPWATLLNQLLSLSSATNTGASALAGQMWNTYLPARTRRLYSPDTRRVHGQSTRPCAHCLMTAQSARRSSRTRRASS